LEPSHCNGSFLQTLNICIQGLCLMFTVHFSSNWSLLFYFSFIIFVFVIILLWCLVVWPCCLVVHHCCLIVHYLVTFIIVPCSSRALFLLKSHLALFTLHLIFLTSRLAILVPCCSLPYYTSLMCLTLLTSHLTTHIALLPTLFCCSHLVHTLLVSLPCCLCLFALEVAPSYLCLATLPSHLVAHVF
jgi:hypothetical protein